MAAACGVSSTAWGAGKESKESSPTEKSMPTVHVTAQSLEARVYTREDMDATPGGNRDISSLVANHPAVRQNPTVDGSGNRGSLAPEAFSIHGESPYQNQFLVDGMVIPP